MFTEDMIKEKLKDIKDEKATYIVKLNYGDIQVEEYKGKETKVNKNQLNLFGGN